MLRKLIEKIYEKSQYLTVRERIRERNFHLLIEVTNMTEEKRHQISYGIHTWTVTQVSY